MLVRADWDAMDQASMTEATRLDCAVTIARSGQQRIA
jgi:hypothetical protein